LFSSVYTEGLEARAGIEGTEERKEKKRTQARANYLYRKTRKRR